MSFMFAFKKGRKTIGASERKKAARNRPDATTYCPTTTPEHANPSVRIAQVASSPSTGSLEAGGLKSGGLAGNACSAVSYRAPRISARHACDADGRQRPSDPSFRRVERQRNYCLLRHLQKMRDRARDRAANKRYPANSKFFS
jgi:hypothetical protein